MPDEIETELIRRAVRGDRQAFASLFERYFQSVYNYALSLSNDPATAEDLTQEAFIKAHTHLPGFKPPWNFRSWIFRMTRNLFLDLMRGRHEADSFDDVPPISAPEPSPESHVIASEATRRVRRALERLSVRNKEVLVLREVHGLSYAEIAEVLDTTQPYVKTLLARSRAQFQDAYGVQLLVEEPTEDCPEVAALLHNLHDGESLQGRERFVREHLDTCEACQRRRNWLVAQSSLLAMFVPVIPPSGVAERILAKIGSVGNVPKPSQAQSLIRHPFLMGAGTLAVVSTIILAIALTLYLTGPSQPIQATASAIPSPTLIPATSTLQATASAVPSSTLAPTGTSTLQVTATLTLTPIPVITEPTGEFTQNANCRKGPGTAYDVVTSLLQGQTVSIDGRNEVSTWWWIALPNGGHCWVSGVTVDVAGPIDDVPVVPMAPPPPSNLAASVSCTSSRYSVALTWVDAAENELGYYIYRDGNRVATLGAGSASYDENFAGRGSHRYSVEAFNSVGSSDRVTVEAPCSAP
ncbi:MAG TPA: sigma-70 family RNA polymerase sigma factor [Anaerolineales bacterium]|nr:sigma-70 family RNA polymerase sigma factor [Anaerolineales bacterium]